MVRHRMTAALAAVLITLCSVLVTSPATAQPLPPVPTLPSAIPAGSRIIGVQTLDIYRAALPPLHCAALTYGPDYSGIPGWATWHDIRVDLTCNYPVYYADTVICEEFSTGGVVDSDCYKQYGSGRNAVAKDPNAPHMQVFCWPSTLQWGHYYWLYMTITDPVTGISATNNKASSIHWDYCKGNGS